MSAQLGESTMSDAQAHNQAHDRAHDWVLWIYTANALFNEVDRCTVTTMGGLPAEFSSSTGLDCGF